MNIQKYVLIVLLLSSIVIKYSIKYSINGMLQGGSSPAIITWSGMPMLGREKKCFKISSVVRGWMKGYGPIYEVERKKKGKGKIKL